MISIHVPGFTGIFLCMKKPIIALTLLSLSAVTLVPRGGFATAFDYVIDSTRVRAERTISLEDRYPDPWVNEVFKDNMLLTLNYLANRIQNRRNIDWPEVLKSQTYSITLNPGDVFVFNDDVLPEFKRKTIRSTNAHYNFNDGFKSSGYLYGDGVCHLASLIYWVSKDAGLEVLAPTNHDFRTIPEIPKEYGVSIYFNPNTPATNAQENLYVTNSLDKPATFRFDYDGKNLTLQVID